MSERDVIGQNGLGKNERQVRDVNRKMNRRGGEVIMKMQTDETEVTIILDEKYDTHQH